MVDGAGIIKCKAPKNHGRRLKSKTMVKTSLCQRRICNFLQPDNLGSLKVMELKKISPCRIQQQRLRLVKWINWENA
jgi:hypothetical protein